MNLNLSFLFDIQAFWPGVSFEAQIIRIVFMTTTTLMQNFITFHEWEVGFLESTEKAVNLKNMTVKVSLMFVWKKDKSFVHFRSNRFRMQSFSCGILSSYKVSKSSEARIMCLEKRSSCIFAMKSFQPNVFILRKRDEIVKCLLMMF